MTTSKLKDALALVANSVSIIAVNLDNKVYGCTISSLQAIDVGDDKPQMMFILKRNSEIGEKLKQKRKFSINALSADQSEIAKQFSNERNPEEIGNESLIWSLKDETPIMKNFTFYSICTLDQVIDFSSSNLFIANVHELEYDPNNSILCYSRRGYGRFEAQID